MNRSYVSRHWLATLLAGPLVSQLLGWIFGPDRQRVVPLLEVYPLSLVFGLVFSLPALAVYLLCFYLLRKLRLDWRIAKAVLIALAVAGILLTMALLGGSLSKDIGAAYSLAALLAGLALRLQSEQAPPVLPGTHQQ